MLRALRMGETTRVSVLWMGDSVHVGMASGASKIAMQLAEPAARALNTELNSALPPGAPVTNRPAAPRYREKEPTNYRAIVHRLRGGQVLPRDVETIAHLLSYLGVRIE